MEQKTILAIKDFIETAERSIKNAKKLLNDILKEKNIKIEDLTINTSGLTNYKQENLKIIEGVFTGEEMLGSDGHKYPVPANYSSKSKLVQGDKLKLTIDTNGKMLYKQIEPIQREIKTGLIIKENGRFKVVCEGKIYNLLTAAVTHFKGEIGDTVSILLPAGKEATFAAIEAIIPKE